MEIWKDLVNYEDLYQVSNFGSVKAKPREWFSGKNGCLKRSHNGFLMKLKNCKDGYISVTLCKDGNVKTHLVHRLVAYSFLNLDPKDKELVVDHIDHNRANNALDNLRLISQRQNTTKSHITSSSKYVGVHFHNYSNKWQSQIAYNKKRIHLGIFETEEQASRAYQLALKQIENGEEIRKEEIKRQVRYND